MANSTEFCVEQAHHYLAEARAAVYAYLPGSAHALNIAEQFAVDSHDALTCAVVRRTREELNRVLDLREACEEAIQDAFQL